MEIVNLGTRLYDIFSNFAQQIPLILVGLTIFTIFILIASLSRRVIRKYVIYRKRKNLSIVLGRVSQSIIIFVGLLVTMAIVMPSVTAGKLVSALGIGGVAIGFAFKDILQNFLAGILILIREPFKIGDQIIYKEFEGTVTNVETRATYLKTYDGKQVIVPNGEIYTNPLIVNTAYKFIRSEYTFGIGYADSIDDAVEVIEKTLNNTDGVLKDPAPSTLVIELADSYVGIKARWWTPSMRSDSNKISSDVIKNTKQALDKAGIDLPFPVRTVLFHDKTASNNH